jgi:hypothetical protein
VSLKKFKSQGQAVEVTVNSKEETFCPNLVQEFGLWKFKGVMWTYQRVLHREKRTPAGLLWRLGHGVSSLLLLVISSLLEGLILFIRNPGLSLSPLVNRFRY